MASPSESNTKLSKHLKQQLEEDGLILFATQAMGSFVVAMALRSAVELGVFDVLAKAAGEGVNLSAKDIADEIDTNNPEASAMLDRLLRTLASYSLLSCSVNPQAQRLYSLSHSSKCFVTDADGASMGATLALHSGHVFYQSWTQLKGAIMEGGLPFNRAHGMHAFEYPNVDTRFNEVFNKAMLTSTTLYMKRILAVYNGFEHVTKVVDVGGGLGINLKLVTSKYPHVHGVNFDLPHVIEHAPVYAGVEHVGGDMFESVPTGDVIFMKWVLHDWSDEHCLKLLKNCYKALPDDGKVIVVDSVVPIVPETTHAAKNVFIADLIMMTINPGGKERTEHEFMELAKGSGFSGIRFVCCVSGLWVMEFFK